jgi:hypothetical protein
VFASPFSEHPSSIATGSAENLRQPKTRRQLQRRVSSQFMMMIHALCAIQVEIHLTPVFLDKFAAGVNGIAHE